MRPQKYTLEQRKEWFGAACFSMVFAHNFSGLIARSWSTEAQGNIPAFSFYGTEREENMEHSSSTKAGILGRPIPILSYRPSLSCSMTNPWISKRSLLSFRSFHYPKMRLDAKIVASFLCFKIHRIYYWCLKMRLYAKINIRGLIC